MITFYTDILDHMDFNYLMIMFTKITLLGEPNCKELFSNDFFWVLPPLIPLITLMKLIISDHFASNYLKTVLAITRLIILIIVTTLVKLKHQ